MTRVVKERDSECGENESRPAQTSGSKSGKVENCGKENLWKEGTGQVYEDERARKERDKRSTFRNEKLDRLPPGRARSRRSVVLVPMPRAESSPLPIWTW